MIDIERKMEMERKLNEYNIKITKMSGYLADYYIDRAIDTEDFSDISAFLISYFAKNLDIGYLISKYKEFGLDKRAEDIDFNINDWYKLKYEQQKSNEELTASNYLSDEDYINYLIEKRKEVRDDNN